MVSISVLGLDSTSGDKLLTLCYSLGLTAHMRALLWIEKTPGIESALILEDGP